MKKIPLLILCAASTAVFGQQPNRPRQGGGGMPDMGQFQGGGGMPDMGQFQGGGSGDFEMGQFQGAQGQGAPAGLAQNATAPAVSADTTSYDDLMESLSSMAQEFSEEDTQELEVFVYECQYIGSEAFRQALEPFLSVNGEISDTQDADLVIIQDNKENLEQLKIIAESIDRPIRQVVVSASIVEFQIKDDFEKELSLQYRQFVNMEDVNPAGEVKVADFAKRMLNAIVVDPATLSGSSSYMYYDPDEQTIFSTFLSFLETKGTARILASPSLIIRRGHTGNIVSGEDVPITTSSTTQAGAIIPQVDYKSIGIKLRVTPQSIFDDRVVLEVSPEVSSINGYDNAGNPVVANRNASTMLEMNDSQMVSIGGLLREQKTEIKKRVPILGSLPIIGGLFRSSSIEETRTQLVIFLTVNVVDSDGMNADTITPSKVTEELQEKVDASDAAITTDEKSSLVKDFKLLIK